MDQAQAKRIQAAQMLHEGISPAKVAVAVGVTRQTVYRWKKLLDTEGHAALLEMHRGKISMLNASQLTELSKCLAQGARQQGFGSDKWSPKRLAYFIEQRYGIQYSEVHAWRLKLFLQIHTN